MRRFNPTFLTFISLAGVVLVSVFAVHLSSGSLVSGLKARRVQHATLPATTQVPAGSSQQGSPRLPNRTEPQRKAVAAAFHAARQRQATARRANRRALQRRRSQRRRWTTTQLIIPRIGLRATVVQGVSKKALRRGPGHDPASALPGEWGNCVIAAHRNAYGWWFYRLGKLGDGSLIWLRTPQGTFTYKVAAMRVVHETQTAILNHPRHTGAAPRLTLYTCTLPKTDNRLVVVANLVGKRSTA